MKQVLQNMLDGKTQVSEVPVPSPRRGFALVRTAASLVSAGTERMLVEFAEKSLVAKARSRPDLVRQVLDKSRREGLLPTISAAFNRLDQPMALGYSSAGVILAVGEGLEGFKVGDRVACAGGNFAVHAEYAVVPQNLLAHVADELDLESAAFTTLGAIALHGFRLAQPQLGEHVAIVGLGLLGLLAAQVARAAGCLVFGVDVSAERVERACGMGFPAVLRADAEDAGRALCQGSGFDAVLICADTRSDDTVELAGVLARDRGTVISVGAVGLDLPRKLYYEKELTFLVSRSYGPGRYDPEYEEGGRDYPIGYARWTEGRNLQSFADLMAASKVVVHPLITHRFSIENAAGAYELITGKRGEPFLGVLLTYPGNSGQQPEASGQKIVFEHRQPAASSQLALGVLGSGNYATAVFLPNVAAVGAALRCGIASASGLSATHAARRFGFAYATSSEQQVLDDPQVNLLAILTRHNSHARQVLAGLERGKNVFCEKPLAINDAELDTIAEALEKPGAPLLMVGFNRRFAPFAIQLKQFFANCGEPLAMHYRVNAGPLPHTHWLHDPQVGGGRIIGEGCHFVDFLTFLVGAPPVSVSAQALPDNGRYHLDCVTLTFTFADGSLGTLNYLANGDKSFPKERVEVFGNGRVAVLDDFRNLELVRDGRRQFLRARLGQDKGHRAAWQAFLNAARTGEAAPIPYEHLVGVTRATFAAMRALHSGKNEPVVPVPPTA
jgi:predicted dehydrogenase/threonine dehydrogenase-like Zn-dependent dehydrogenase